MVIQQVGKAMFAGKPPLRRRLRSFRHRIFGKLRQAGKHSVSHAGFVEDVPGGRGSGAWG